MRATFEFILEYMRKSVNQQIQLSQSLRYLYNLLFGSIQKVQIYKISGLAENSDKKITTLFAGNAQGAHQFASLVYHQIDRIVPIRQLRFNQITHTITANTSGIIAIRVEKPSAHELEEQGYFLLPNVRFSLDLRRSFDEIIKRMSRRRRRDIKKIEALNYSYTIHKKDNEAFEFFYWKMYMPYASQRFGEAAYIKGYSESKAFYKTGGQIIFVKKYEKPIAGILFRVIGKTLYAISIGSHQENEENARQLASQAALLFLVKWGKTKGLESLDYGTSLPYFREGIFTYKKEWRMSLEESIDQSYCALKFGYLDAGTLPFLEKNPFIVSDNGTLRGVVFIGHKATNDELQQIFSQYFLPKLSSIVFVTYYRPDSELSDIAELSTNLTEYAQVLSKPLLKVCLLLQENAFKVEVIEIEGIRLK